MAVLNTLWLCRGTMTGEQWNAEGQHVAPSLSTAFHTGPGTAPHITNAASQADRELPCSRTGLGQPQSSTSSMDTASSRSSMNSHSSVDMPFPSSHRDIEVRGLPLAQRGAQVCSPAAPRLEPLTMTPVTQQAPGPQRCEAEGPCSALARGSLLPLPQR